MLRIGLASDALFLRAVACGGAVAALERVRRVAAQLNELGIVDTVAEGFLNRTEVSLVPVRGDPCARRRATPQNVHEGLIEYSLSCPPTM